MRRQDWCHPGPYREGSREALPAYFVPSSTVGNTLASKWCTYEKCMLFHVSDLFRIHKMIYLWAKSISWDFTIFGILALSCFCCCHIVVIVVFTTVIICKALAIKWLLTLRWTYIEDIHVKRFRIQSMEVQSWSSKVCTNPASEMSVHFMTYHWVHMY